MPLPGDKAWFPKKKRGWGWGLPVKWQGWAVMLIYILLFVIAGTFIAGKSTKLYTLFILVTTGILVYICYRKGEKLKYPSEKNN